MNTPSPALSTTKQRIAKHFCRAANHYSTEASLQHHVADQLLELLSRHTQPSLDATHNQPGRILDLGCGSGRELKQLAARYPDSDTFGIDLSETMLTQAAMETRLNQCWVGGDIDAIPIKSSAIDMLYSSLAIQWCTSFAHALEEIHRVCTPGATVAISTLASGSLSELAIASEKTDSFQHSNSFPTLIEQRSILEASEFEIVELVEVTELEHFATFAELLRNLKRTGVTTVAEKPRPGLMTPKQLRQMESAFEQFRQPQGLPLRYQVIYAILRAR